MRSIRPVQAIFATLLLTACGSSGRITADEKQAGTDSARQVEEQIGIYQAEFLTTYVDAVGRRLVASLDAKPHDFRFGIIDRGAPNAFVLPGGTIYVSRGLITLINTEDELAGILAHEITHVTGRHHASQSRRDAQPGILTSPGRAISKVVGEDIGNIINTPIEAAGGASVASYGRDQEREADLLGMQLAARAGYDPAALGTVLYNIDRTDTLLTGERRMAEYFDNHPGARTRITDIELEAASISWTPARPFAQTRQALLERLDGLPWGADNPMQGILRGQQFLHPDMDISIIFPDGFKAVNTPLFVGAFAPGNQALILLGSAEEPGPAAKLAAAFIAQMRKEADLEPTEARPVDIDIGPAWLVRYEDISGGQPVSITYLWVNGRNTTFRLIAVGADSFRDQIRDSVLGFRNLSAEEKASIIEDRIRPVAAIAGESISALSARTGNQFSPELTAAVNGMPDDVVLKQDQFIKILRRNPYFR